MPLLRGERHAFAGGFFQGSFAFFGRESAQLDWQGWDGHNFTLLGAARDAKGRSTRLLSLLRGSPRGRARAFSLR